MARAKPLIGSPKPTFRYVPNYRLSKGPEAVELWKRTDLNPLFEWQERAAKDFLAYKAAGDWVSREGLLLCPRQNGKALDVETPMWTPNGLKTMGTLVPGDYVYGSDGKPTQVVATTEFMYDRPCYEVTLTDGRSVVADANHVWTVQDKRKEKCVNGKRGNYVWENLTTEELINRGVSRTYVRPNGRASQVNNFVMPKQPIVEGTNVDLPVDPYVLGYWLGDGTSANGGITVSAADLEEALEHLNWTNVGAISPTGTAYRVGLKGLQAPLRTLGVLGDKHIPDSYMNASIEQRLALLQGLMDTDGCISQSQGQAEFCGNRKVLCEGVLALVRSLGFTATMVEHVATLNGRAIGPRYRVFFTPDASDLPVFRFRRKLERIRVRQRPDRTTRIASIERVESRPVRCIQVAASDGLFLAGRELIVTHNSELLAAIVLYLCVVEQMPRIVFSAHELRTAKEIYLTRIKPALEALYKFGYLETRPKLKEGNSGIEATVDGSTILFTSRTTNALRGYSIDALVIDEAFALTADQDSALRYTVAARPDALILYASSAGMETSEVLEGLRNRGYAKNMTVLDWAADPDDDFSDEKVWAKTNPSYGLLLMKEVVQAEFDSPTSVNSFGRERLGCWELRAKQEDPPIFEESVLATCWTDSLIVGSTVFAAAAEGGRTGLSFIAVCGESADGTVVAQLVKTNKGTSWLPDYLTRLNLVQHPHVITVDGVGSMSAVIGELEQLQANGSLPLKVVNTNEAVRAQASFEQAIYEGHLKLSYDEFLHGALSDAKTRKVYSGLLWDIPKTESLKAPLEAVTLAYYGWLSRETFTTIKKKRPGKFMGINI